MKSGERRRRPIRRLWIAPKLTEQAGVSARTCLSTEARYRKEERFEIASLRAAGRVRDSEGNAKRRDPGRAIDRRVCEARRNWILRVIYNPSTIS